MSIKKSVLVFFTSFILSSYCLNLYSDTKELEIVNLSTDVQAHKYVQDYIKEHNLNISDVIEAYKEAMSKREKGNPRTIFEERDNFVIYISPEEKMIFSIGPNGPVQRKGEG